MIKNIIFSIIFIILIFSCSSEEVIPSKEPENTIELPTVSTSEILEIESISALLGGEIISNGGGVISERGIVWGTNTNPSFSDNKISKGKGLGAFQLKFENLDLNTTYFVRAFATNEKGTSFGIEKSFTSLNSLFMFTTGYINRDVTHNLKDKLIYFYTFPGQINNDPTGTIIAYDYDKKQIAAQIEIDKFQVGYNHSIGEFNGKRELYVLTDKNEIKILDALTLDELHTIPSPENTTSAHSGAKLFAGFLFIVGPDGIHIFDRESLTEITTIPNNLNAKSFTVFQDQANNIIKVLTFNSNSSSKAASIDSLNMSGNYLGQTRWSFKGSEVYFKFNKTNDNVDFILRGEFGDIYRKSNLKNQNNRISEVRLDDIRILPDGDFVYSIWRDSIVRKYNSNDLHAMPEEIKLKQQAEHVFIDGDKIIVIDHDPNPNGFKTTDVFISEY